MATLVQFLAAGANGGEGGSATFLLRGTASSAAAFLYTDFERTAQPGTNVISLDANGAAEIYCRAYCDVVLRDADGTTLRTVTIGNSDSLVEVRSDSFTGTDYDGDPANQTEEPVTLRTVLDRWNDSAGATNWQVAVNGDPTNLQAALSGFVGMFVNVKDPTYGATGDGVTDDTTAILAATVAANGGIVFFPAGTYKLTTLTLTGANVNWLGSGAGASIISGTTDSELIALGDNTITAWKNFTGLSFTSSGTYSRLFFLEESQNVSFNRCSFDASQCTADCIADTAAAGLSKYLFTDCDFTLGASTTRGIYNQAAVGARHIAINGCNFKVPAGFTGSIIVGADFMVDNCLFDASLVVTGAYYHVDAESGTVAGTYVGSFTGCRFLDGGSAGYAFKLTDVATDCDFSESGNSLVGFTEPTALTDAGHIYDYSNDAGLDLTSKIMLGSRSGRSGSFLHSSGGSVGNIRANLFYDVIYINHTQADNSAFTFSTSAPVGLKWSLGLANNSGGSRNLGFGVTGIVAATTVGDTGFAYADYFTYFDSGVKFGRTELAVT